MPRLTAMIPPLLLLVLAAATAAPRAGEFTVDPFANEFTAEDLQAVFLDGVRHLRDNAADFLPSWARAHDRNPGRSFDAEIDFAIFYGAASFFDEFLQAHRKSLGVPGAAARLFDEMSIELARCRRPEPSLNERLICARLDESCKASFGYDHHGLFRLTVNDAREIVRFQVEIRPIPRARITFDNSTAYFLWIVEAYCSGIGSVIARQGPDSLLGTAYQTSEPLDLALCAGVVSAAHLAAKRYLLDFPGSEGVREYAAYFEGQHARCVEIAKRECAGVYYIRDVPALAYTTGSCRLRRVTSRDIDNDITSARMSGLWTEAEQLEHSLLKDRIEQCDVLHARGVTWEFKEPELSQECRSRADPPAR